MHYHIRLTCPHTQATAVTRLLHRYADAAFAMFEVSRQGVEHFHCYMETKAVLHTVQGYVRTELPELGRRDKMVKEISVDTLRNCQRYICKGRESIVNGKTDFELIYRKAIQTQFLDELHDEFWENNTPPMSNSVVSTITVPSTVTTKKKQDTFVEKCYRECIEKHIMGECDDIVFRYNVFKVVMRMLGKNGKGLDQFIVKRLVQGVMNMLNPKSMEQYIWRQMNPNDCMNGLEYLFD